MQRSDIPTKIPVPFARDADGAHKRTVPASTPFASGGATFQYGWQNINFLPTASGGIPPFGQEFNGLFEQLTQWHRWSQASAPVVYDSTFSAAIGGYPLGARVESGVTSGLFWVSTAESNTSNPDSGGANWSVPFFPDPSTSGLIVHSTTANGANLKFEGSGATSPNKYLRAQNGNFEIVNHAYNAAIFGVNNAGDVYAVRNVTGSGTVQGANVTASSGNVTATGGSLVSTYDASIGRNLGVGGQSQVNGISYFGTSGQFYVHPAAGGSNRLLNFAAGEFLQFIPGTGFLLVTGGGSIALTAPAGVVISHSMTVGANVAAAGNIGASGQSYGSSVQATNGNVTANNGRLRASFGAYLSGDANAGVILSDFNPASRAGNEGYTYSRLPDGTIIQSYIGTTVTGADFVVFPFAFPTACANVVALEGAPGGWALSGGLGNLQPTVFGIQQISNTSFALYCTQPITPGSSTWTLKGGISYRWIAWGY